MLTTNNGHGKGCSPQWNIVSHLYFILHSIFTIEMDAEEKNEKLMKRAARFGHHLETDSKRARQTLTLSINSYTVSIAHKWIFITVDSIPILPLQ